MFPLSNYVKLGLENEQETNQAEITEKLINNLSNKSNIDQSIIDWVKFVKSFNKLNDNLSLDESYFSLSLLGINFDRIKFYECDNSTKLLTNVNEQTVDGFQFYSQINDSE